MARPFFLWLAEKKEKIETARDQKMKKHNARETTGRWSSMAS